MAGHQYVISSGESPGSMDSPPQEWPNDSGTPDMIEKALQVVGETLEKPSTVVAMGAWAGCFFQLCELRQRLHCTMQ